MSGPGITSVWSMIMTAHRMSAPYRLPMLLALLAGMASPSSAAARSPWLPPEARHPSRAPFQGPADERPVFTGWQLEAAGGNSVTLDDEGVLTFSANQGSIAQLSRPLAQDSILARCELTPLSYPGHVFGASTGSLYLVWDAENWCEIGINGDNFGRLFMAVCVDGKIERRGLCHLHFDELNSVAISIDNRLIRFHSSRARQPLRPRAWIDRPASFDGPPSKLVVGSGPVGVTAGLPEGERMEYRVAGVRVESFNAGQLRPFIEPDRFGEEAMALSGGPTFAAVSRYFPEMIQSREVIGVKDSEEDFVIGGTGEIWVGEQQGFFEVGEPPVRFGEPPRFPRKRLVDGYLPAVVSSWDYEGLEYETTAVATAIDMADSERVSAFLRLQVRNPAAADRAVRIRFVMSAAEVDPAEGWHLTVAAGGLSSVCIKVPYEPAGGRVSAITEETFLSEVNRAREYWNDLLAVGMTIRVPEQRVTDACRAWLAYNFINVRRLDGQLLPVDGVPFYNKVYGYSAAVYVHALDRWGHHESAKKYIDSLLTRLRPDGLFDENFGLPSHGGLLVAIGEHARLTRDTRWLNSILPQIRRMADWVIAARAAALSNQDSNAPWRGMIKGWPYCDWGRPEYSLQSDAYLAAGLRGAAAAMRMAGHLKEADRYAAEAEAYVQDIKRRVERTAVSLLPLGDPMPIIPAFAESHELLLQGGFQPINYYGLTVPCALETDLFEPRGSHLESIIGPMRERGGLILQNNTFFDHMWGGIDHAYSYGYLRSCLRRDEPLHALVGFYAWLAYGMSRETYAGVEVSRIRRGEHFFTSPHLYSGSQQLRLLRDMLVDEEDGVIHLARGAAAAWYQGAGIDVRRAPTSGGQLSYRILLGEDGLTGSVEISPPDNPNVALLSVTLRHPGGKGIKSAAIDGRQIEHDRQRLIVPSSLGPCTIAIRFQE